MVYFSNYIFIYLYNINKYSVYNSLWLGIPDVLRNCRGVFAVFRVEKSRAFVVFIKINFERKKNEFLYAIRCNSIVGRKKKQPIRLR